MESTSLHNTVITALSMKNKKQKQCKCLSTGSITNAAYHTRLLLDNTKESSTGTWIPSYDEPTGHNAKKIPGDESDSTCL